MWLISDLPPLFTSSSDITENDLNDEDGALEDVSGVDSKGSRNKGRRRSKKIRKKTSEGSKSSTSSESTIWDQGQLLQLQFAKSALAMNPCMVNRLNVVISMNQAN